MTKLFVKYGNCPDEMVPELLDKLEVERDLKKLNKDNPLIGIKPNLVVAKPSDSGATTSPKIIQSIIEYLKSKNFNNIIILEGSGIGETTTKKAFEVCGYNRISNKYQVPLIDLKQDKYEICKVDDLKIEVCKKALEVDYLINIPVLKAHSQTKLTCALKNLKGCIPDKTKRRFHTMGLHKPIAYLNKILKSSLIIVDGIIGDLVFEEGGNPLQMNRIIAGKDPVLVDSYAAELLGYSIEDIEYIKIAEALGLGSARPTQEIVEELNVCKQWEDVTCVFRGKALEPLKRCIIDNQACSVCYSNLIQALKRLHEKGKLHKLNQKIYIGQAFKGKKSPGIGVGLCTRGFNFNVSGCPPKAREIVNFLGAIIDNDD